MQAADASQSEPSVRHRLARLWPYFGRSPSTWLIVVVATIIGAGTEPFIPAMLQPLLDKGFQRGALQVWYVPLALLGLFGLRGIAGYVTQIGLSQIANVGLVHLRQRMFEAVLHADPRLFAQHSASALSNTLVYEVQSGSLMLVNSLLSVTRNSLTLLALTAYLLILNWQLALVVAAVAPAVVWVMRVLSGRLQRLMRANQHATDELAYVVEENVLAFRDVRLYGAQQSQAGRFDRLSRQLRQLALKATVAGAAMTPMTQILAAAALSVVFGALAALTTQRRDVT